MAEAKPWEDYAPTQEAEAKPWEEYATAPKLEAKPWEDYQEKPEEEQRGKPILDSEIAEIAKKNKLPPEAYMDYLRSAVEFRGGSTETPVDFEKAMYAVGGFVGESLLFGVPQFIQKKTEDDPRIRAALDDLGALVSERKTYLRTAAEIVPGLLTGGAEVALAKGAVKAGAKALGKEIAETTLEKVVAPATAAAIGATASVAKSREGEELVSGVVGAGVGAAAPYVLTNTVKGLGWIKNRVTRDAAEQAAKEVAESPDLVKMVRDEASKESGLTEIVGDLINKQVAKPGDKAVAAAVNNVDDLIPMVGEEKILKAGQQILESMSEQTRDSITKELAQFGAPVRQMARLVQMKLDDALPQLADEIGEKAGSAREALQVVASRAGEGAEFLSRRYLDSVEKRAHGDLVNQRLVERALGSAAEVGTIRALGRYFSDYQFVFRQMDRLRGTRLEPVLNAWNEKNNAFTRHLASAAKRIGEAQKQVKEAGLTANELYNALNKPGVVQFTGAKGQAVEAYKQLFTTLREEANALGLNIAKLENYVPHFLKDHLQIAQTVRQRLGEIEQRYGINLLNYSQTEYGSAMSAGMGEAPLYRELKDGLEYLYGDKIGTPELLQDFLAQQMNPKTAGTRSFSKAAATYRRTAEEVPLLFRETDVNRLAVRWASTTLKHAYLRNEFAAVEKARDMFAQAGFRGEAENLTRWLTDNLGGTRPNTWRSATQELQNILLNMADKGGNKAQLANWLLEAGPNIFMRATAAVYPNFLGLKVASALQNMTQPFLVTAPELGAELGPRYLLRTVSKVKDVKKLWQDAEQYSAAQWNTQLQFALESGLKRSWIGEKTDATIQQYTKIAMGMYEVAEKSNRTIVVSMGRELAKDVLAGDKVATQYVQQLNIGMRREIMDAIAAKDSAQVEKLLVNNLLDKTIFQYNRGSMSEFGRTWGPIFSTFSKWPTVLVGDVIDTYERRGIGKGNLELARKYLGPLVLLAALNAAISGGRPFTQEDEQIAATIGGKQGLTSLSPLMSLKQEWGTPPVFQSGRKVMEGALTGDINKVMKGLTSMGDAYIPVIPGILRSINDVSKMTTGEETEVRSLESLLDAVTE